MLDAPEWPPVYPLQPRDFGRYDETPDSDFYESPRFVTHIDDKAIGAVTKWYGANFPASGQKDVAILDMCSSWISHFPQGYTAGRICGLGMNEKELARNAVLTDYVVHDLNANPEMAMFEDESFDVIVNAVSVDYLNQPLKIFRDAHRILKPGGLMACSFSNRCFPTKVIDIWAKTGDVDHVWIVGSYFHYSVPGGFTAPKCDDISPSRNPVDALFGGGSDPMYVVYARKAEA